MSSGAWHQAGVPLRVDAASKVMLIPADVSAEIRQSSHAQLHKRTIPLSYAGITQIRFKGTKANRLISAVTAPLVDFLV
ncbi:hypothetical protein ASG81_11805 [Paenibacillus sp. Soil522]|nr:hypothetical protein ASG81_11805 [Paenibacillus sp. Soil522]